MVKKYNTCTYKYWIMNLLCTSFQLRCTNTHLVHKHRLWVKMCSLSTSWARELSGSFSCYNQHILNIHADHHQNNKYKAIIPFFNIKKIQKKIIYEYFIWHHFIERMGIKKYWAMKIFIMRSDKINMKMWSWICHIATLKWLVKLYSKFDCNSHGTKNDQWLYMYIFIIFILLYIHI